ncbi:amino acid adenylation domain-containing protein [Brucella pseudogrignonensis]|uniref:amino acid adenylation domain-containing protein n=1 Tax=Brucella pseudogrignonensis TaxID=419475 RepID=UPI0038B4C696
MPKFPLLSTQQGIWFADQVATRRNAYVIAHAIELSGKIDLAHLEEAIGLGLSEADTVMAQYGEDETGAWQMTHAGSVPPVDHIDVSTEADPEAAARRFMQEDIDADLDVNGKRPLCYQALIHLGDSGGNKRLFWYQRYHHVMLDGFSFTALTRRVADIYSALSEGHAVTAFPFRSVSEVIEERRAYEVSEACASDREYWSAYCRDLPPQASPSIRSGHEGDGHIILRALSLPADGFSRLQACANAHRVTIFDLVTAAIAAYLFRVTGEKRQAIGVPFMRRMGSVALNSTAPVVNVLPLCIDVDAGASLLTIATGVKKEMREARRHQRYDAEQIQRDIGLVGSGRALYGPVINYRMFDYDLRFGAVEGRTHRLAVGPVDDIEFGIVMAEEQVEFELRGHSALYNEADLDRHGARLARLIDAFLHQESIIVSDLPVMDHDEEALIAEASRGPLVERPQHLNTIIDVFAQQAMATPDKTALVFGEARLNFATLAARVFRLARYLIAQGVGPGDSIAVGVPRSEKAVIAAMAVLASGATYLPLDLDYPAERLAHMCAEARPRFILTQGFVEALPEEIATIDIDDPAIVLACAAYQAQPISDRERRAPLGGEHVAYIIFTSGSTGRPKGVMNSHAGLLNLFLAHAPTIYHPGIRAVTSQYGGRALRAAHTHSFAFDSSWLQIFWMLHGQELHIMDEDLRRDAERLVEVIDSQRIDALDLPPSFCMQMLSCGLMQAGRHHPTVLLIGGEAASPILWTALRHYPALQAHNLYGPTEFTVDALRAPIHATSEPVIGRPIGNARALVLDDCLKPAAIGVVGELYLSGSGLARGYLERPDLTAERFVSNPFDDGERMYRTGDRVRWNAQGEVEFLGRADHQVKVRGYRIETTEIEAALLALEGVEAALVVAEPVEGSHRLIAYCIAHNANEDKQVLAQSLRRQLREHLPDYMVPAALVVLDAFPLTVNGKIDRAQLPAPTVSVERLPGTAEEIAVCQAMAEVLKLPAVGLEHDFFAHGGDSITAIALCTALRRKGFSIRPRDVFAGRDAQGMAAALKPATGGLETAPVKDLLSSVEMTELEQRYGAIDSVVPALATQKGMFFHTQLGDRTSNYNAFTRLALKGKLDSARLRRAFDAVLRRHPQLAGVFDADGRDEPVLVIPKLDIGASGLWPWEEHDLTALPEGEHNAALARLEALCVERDLIGNSFSRLISAMLVHLADNEHVLILVVHHLMIDGWSTPLLLRDLFDAYRNNGAELPALPNSYQQVVTQLSSRDTAPDKATWREALNGVVPTRLFDDAPAGATVEEFALKLSRKTSEVLLAQARQRGITLNVLMQAVWATLLGSMAGRNDIVFGTPVAGRSVPVEGLGEQVGLFLNTIPVRVNLKADASLWAQAQAMQARQAELMEHDGIGLGDIQALAGGKPLFDTLLVVENYPDNDYLGRDIGGMQVSDIHNRGYSHYPLALLVLPGEELTLLVENRGAVTDAQALAERVAGLLDTLVHEPEMPLAALPLCTEGESRLIEKVNATNHALPPLTLADLLLAQAGRTPDAIALIDAEHSLTFREVRHQALHLAQALRENGVGDIVAVALPRSARLSIALLAVIEAGAAFLPLDLDYPADRLSFMLEDAEPRMVIADASSSHLIENRPHILFDRLADPSLEVRDLSGDHSLGPDSPAYVLYTSGTTGRPKGVIVSHAAIVNRLLWMQHQYPIDSNDVILQKTPCGFDVSVWEFFWSYITGAQLVMAPPSAHRDPTALISLIDDHKVTVLHFVPSMLAIFLATIQEQNAACPTLRQVFCSGEALARSLARDFTALLDAELHNLYGPTEAAIDVTYSPACAEQIAGGGSVPIGLPVWNTRLHILDHLLRPVPVGVPGELYLGGVQLGQGYLGRPELTATRFVADIAVPGARMYRTGDIARWLANGQVEYLGRTDHQIKIRGQRVELGEIEAQIEALPGVKQAVVHAVARGVSTGFEGADERQLFAYIVSKPGAVPAVETFAELLKAVLPAHMVPVAFMVLEALPLSPNGKRDRKALPLPSMATTSARAPAQGLESRIAAIFAELLDRDFVGADEDFFAIGGHSLLAMRLAARIRRDLKRQVSVGQIMIMPTVAQLAQHLVAGEAVGEMAKGGFEPVIRLREGDDTPLICIYPGSGVSWQYSVLSRYLRAGRPIIGLQSPRPDGPVAMSQSIDEVCERQLAIVREVQPQGPYYLLGYSLGGTIAYGVATRLRRMGEDVRFLGLLDTYPCEEHDWSDPQGAEANRGAEREQEQFINDAMVDVMDDAFRREKEEMFGHIFENYRDSVALLSKARTPQYDGHVTLFVAGKSVPPGINPETCWNKHTASISIHRLPHCSHEDIVSPASLEILGPLLNTLIENAALEVDAVLRPQAAE